MHLEILGAYSPGMEDPAPRGPGPPFTSIPGHTYKGMDQVESEPPQLKLAPIH